MKSFLKSIIAIGAIATMGLTSCVDDLNQQSPDPNQISNVSGKIDEVFANIYLSFATYGPNGNSQVHEFDGGMASFQRAMFIAEEIPTDEACWLWDPGDYGQLNYGYATTTLNAAYGFYSRLIINITLCNDFIRNAEAGNFGVSATDPTVADYIRQAKTLRSACYFYMLSFYDKIPYADEQMETGTVAPQLPRATVYENVKATLKEVIASYQEAGNTTPAYGYVGVDVADAILAKLTLNAEVFRGTGDYQECYQACDRIIKRLGNGGHYNNGLAYSYQGLFGFNNDQYVLGNPGSTVNEIIWTIPQNYPNLLSYSGATFLIAAWLGTNGVQVTMPEPTTEKYDDEAEYHAKNQKYYDIERSSYDNEEDYNDAVKEYEDAVKNYDETKKDASKKWQVEISEEINGVYYSFDPSATGWVSQQWYNAGDGWKCMVARRTFVTKFDWEDTDYSISKDRRVANWQTSKHGFNLDNKSLVGDDWGMNGYLTPKYTNWAYNEDGTLSANQPDATAQVGGDYAVIRLAEIYLTAAEAILQGGGGSEAEALRYVNYVRQRAYGQDANGKDIYTPWTNLTMEELQDERCRELYGENTRRTDLIRWNLWCTGYTWDWKGGVKAGTNLPEYTKLYPIPSRVIVASDYEQTTGY